MIYYITKYELQARVKYFTRYAIDDYNCIDVDFKRPDSKEIEDYEIYRNGRYKAVIQY